MGDGTKENPFTREDVEAKIKENGETAEGLNLSGKHFQEGINLYELNLKKAHLEGAHLEEAFLGNAHLEEAHLESAHLEGAGAHIEETHFSFWDIHLEGAYLEGAHLERAHLGNANLEGADLEYANLEEADLGNANLEGAHLGGTHLEGAYLESAHLEEAHLESANLEGADLGGANLEGAYLGGTHLEGAYLGDAKFSPETKLEEADWGNFVLGEEINLQFGTAADTYRRLKTWHTNAGYSDIAAKFYYREKEASRKSLILFSKSWNHRIALQLSYWVFGHGEGWKRILIWMAVVVFGLAAAYYFWGSFSSSSFWDTLYYSATSFSALGYGNWAPQPTGWAKGMGAAEAIIGVFTMALLLVTFVRKWTR